MTPLTSKKLITPNFFFFTLPLTPLTSEKTWMSQRKTSKALLDSSLMLPLMPLTSENWYVSHFFIVYFYRWRRWHQKNIHLPIFFSTLPFTPLTFEKHEWVKEKLQKQWWFDLWCCRWHRWHYKKLMNQPIFYLNIYRWRRWHQKNIWLPIFFSLLCRWHRWQMKKHEWVKGKYQTYC